jgi:NADPH2:quinone reductase
MTNTIRILQHGGPEVLQLDHFEVGQPGPGEVRIRQNAIGLNFIDVYVRTGLYPVPELPCGIGFEGAGIIEETGENVESLAVGDRVAYAGGPLGAYANERVIPAEYLVKLPDSISDIQAAAMMLQGLTAHYLMRQIYRVKAGDTILMHAAAGGVGLILCQWANALGVEVIGTVGSEKKAALAKENGCAHTILYREENFAERVREITNGKGVPVVFDSVGQATFMDSLDCLQKFGLMVSYGNATGPVTDLHLGVLANKGSLFVTRPLLWDYIDTPEALTRCSQELFEVVSDGRVKIHIEQRYSLADAAQAHTDLEARKTVGSTVLIP